MIKKIIYLVLMVIFAASVYFGYGWYKLNNISPATGNLSASTTIISLDTLQSHGGDNDCWISIYKKVYNVTEFIVLHPGGTVIKQGCGKDATELFKSVPKHAKASVDQILTKLWIGTLSQ